MESLVKFYFILFLLTANCCDRVAANYRRYASLITDVHKYYGTSSVMFLFSPNDQSLQDYTLVNSLTREFSKHGVLTLTLNFKELIYGKGFYHKRIVRPLVVVILKSVNDMNEFHENTRMSSKSSVIWLVIFVDTVSKTVCEYCNNPIGNIFGVRFDTEMLVVCCRDPMLKEWWSVGTNHTETANFATWTRDEGFKLIAAKGLYARRHDVRGAKLRVAIVTNSGLVHDHGYKIGGFHGVLLEELKRAMNFTITEIVRDIEFGHWCTQKKKWTGVVGKLADRRADLGVGEFTMTNARLDVVDYTLPLMTTHKRLYLRAPDGSGIRWYSYLEVFHHKIWITLIVLIITTPIILTVIREKKGSVSLTHLIMENYLDVWGIFCQQGVPEFPTESPLRIAYVSIFLSAVVVSASYSASLISFLTVSSVSLPFSTLHGFAEDKSYKLIATQNGSVYDFIRIATDPDLRKMMTMMTPWENLPQTSQEGFDRVCKEKVAYFSMEVVRKSLANYIKCKLAVIDSGRLDNLAMILPLDSPYTKVVNYHIQRFEDNGMLNHLKQTYLQDHVIATTTHSFADIWTIAPILSVFTCAAILSIVLLFCEKMYYSQCTNMRKSSPRINGKLVRGIL